MYYEANTIGHDQIYEKPLRGLLGFISLDCIRSIQYIQRIIPKYYLYLYNFQQIVWLNIEDSHCWNVLDYILENWFVVLSPTKTLENVNVTV